MKTKTQIEEVAQEIQNYFFERGATLRNEDWDWLVDTIEKFIAENK